MTHQSPRNYEESIVRLRCFTPDSAWGVQNLVALLAAVGAVGCAASSAPPRSSASVERSTIAPGVELVVSEAAGPEAVRIADEVRAKYAAELITSRPMNTPRWPAR